MVKVKLDIQTIDLINKIEIHYFQLRLNRIQKRLGNQLYKQLTELFEKAFSRHMQSETKDLFRGCLSRQ